MTLRPIRHILTQDRDIHLSVQQLQIPGLHLLDSSYQQTSAECIHVSRQDEYIEDIHNQSVASADAQHTQLIIPGLEPFF